MKVCKIKSIKKIKNKSKKYDLQIKDNHNYFANDILVHNCNMYRNYFHARSIDGNSHSSQSYDKNLHSKISYDIPENWRLCGENLYAKHSIKYNNLKSYFLLFSIWNEKNVCLSWDATLEWVELIGINTVPVVYEGLWDEEKIRALTSIKEYDGDPVEGYVVRLRDSFSYRDFKVSIAKYVSEEFREDLKHEYNWRYKSFNINKLEKKEIMEKINGNKT